MEAGTGKRLVAGKIIVTAAAKINVVIPRIGVKIIEKEKQPRK